MRGKTDRIEPAYRYDAFISYRHAEPDREWAKWLHHALETWRTPATLVAQGVKPRLAPVFRDEDELPASADLSREIDAALEQSRFLIVVCSPRTPGSRWVNQEIVRFREMQRDERILALLIEGEPSDSFPPALRTIRRKLTEAHGTREAIEEVEPLAADVRASRDEKPAFLKRLARLRMLACVLGCRFDDLRRREQERHRRRLLVAVGVLTGVVALLAALSVLALQQKDLADQRAIHLGQALDEVLRLSDVKTVKDLVKEEGTLWPIHPDSAPAMVSWIERAKAAVGSRATHEASLARLRQHPESFGSDRTTAWRDQTLTDLLEDLSRLQNEKASAEGLLGVVALRHEKARTLRARSIDAYAAEWTQTQQGIATSPKYGGLSIAPQLGLVPLGPDSDSGLFEFAQLDSGSIPKRDPAGRLSWEDDTAVVLVLIPGGSFRMGAQRINPWGANYDAEAQPNEFPDHGVKLQPYFLAKHECTQAQWAAMTGGERPSYYTARTHRDEGVRDRNPADQLSWVACEKWLGRNRLSLPTEAQWEYACRAGTGTPWWSGTQPAQLGGVANVADRWASMHGGTSVWIYTYEVDDGHTWHAPVGSFRANAFGLYDMHGNVWEWCQDLFAPYWGDPATVQRDGRGYRVLRGGGWHSPATLARSASRNMDVPLDQNTTYGVRPARPIDSD